MQYVRLFSLKFFTSNIFNDNLLLSFCNITCINVQTKCMKLRILFVKYKTKVSNNDFSSFLLKGVWYLAHCILFLYCLYMCSVCICKWTCKFRKKLFGTSNINIFIVTEVMTHHKIMTLMDTV